MTTIKPSEEIYSNIFPVLPDNCKSVLNLGTRFPELSAFINDEYKKVKTTFVTEDITTLERDIIVNTLLDAGVQSVDFVSSKDILEKEYKLPKPKHDLVISFFDVGFHKDPTDYIDFIKKTCKKGATLILDVRVVKPEWKEVLDNTFQIVEVVQLRQKYERLVYKVI